MFPSGTVYHFQKKVSHGEVYLHAPLKTQLLYMLLRGIGSGLIGFVIITFIFTFGPAIKEEVSYRLGRNKLYAPSQTELINAKNTSTIQQEAKYFGVDSYFSIVIPKIGAKANIIANVDAANEEEYNKALLEGVAHAKGTYFPNQGKTIFLFAHSTNGSWNISRYNAVFYLLDKLNVGDQVLIYFADKRYIYEVYDTKITTPEDTSFFTSNKNIGETLILQTCYPPGTSWNRLLIFAKPV